LTQKLTAPAEARSVSYW